MANITDFSFMDAQGLTIGFIVFSIALIFSIFLLKKVDLDRTLIGRLVVICACGHFIGALCNYWFSITAGSDSIIYFNHSFGGDGKFGYFFAMNFLDFLRKYFIGDSLLAAFLLFGAFGFLGSVYYLLTYKLLLDKISGKNKLYFTDPKQLLYPAILLLCWPSYFFWSAGLVKDSFSFLSIGMLLYVVARGDFRLSNIATLLTASFLGIMTRPYLFFIVMLAAIIYIMLGTRWNMFIKSLVLLLLVGLISAVLPMLSDYGSMLNLDSASKIGEFAVTQQNNMHLGTSIPVPTQNPHLIFFFLPYLVSANLFLPLGIGASSLISIVSSVENAFLMIIVIFFLNNRWVWKNLKNELRITKFFMLYFLCGMSCLGLICTNLGLAMREKILYVPALLVCICLVYAYKRILIIQDHFSEQE